MGIFCHRLNNLRAKNGQHIEFSEKYGRDFHLRQNECRTVPIALTRVSVFRIVRLVENRFAGLVPAPVIPIHDLTVLTQYLSF